MSGSLQQRILALVCACPEVALILWAIVEPEVVHLHARKWVARQDSHRAEHCLITLHPADDPAGPPKIVLVVDCQLEPDEEKLLSWPEHLAAARSLYRAIGRVLVMCPNEDVVVWAHDAFTDEPQLEPELVSREHVPRVEDLDRAIAQPELAVLSAVFHGPHPNGTEIAITAAQALRTLPEQVRRDYAMLLEDVLPEQVLSEIRRAAPTSDVRRPTQSPQDGPGSGPPGRRPISD
jgi:hypothetical protein